MKKLKVLISGHTGFLGSSLSSKLKLDDRFDLILMSRSNGYDLTNMNNLKDIKCDIVINLSGLVSIEEGWADPHSMFKDNYLITLNLLELSRINQASFIHISSYVYGVPKYLPIDEQHPVSGYNPYSSTKAILDLLSTDYGKHFKFPVTVLRPFNLYGENQKTNFFISSLMNTIISKKSFDIIDLNARRDYLWVGDFISAIEKVIFSQKEGVHIYNVGSGKSYSANEVIDTIQNCTGQSVNFYQSHPKTILIQDCYSDNKLFSHDFNWKPGTSIDQGIKKIYDCLKM